MSEVEDDTTSLGAEFANARRSVTGYQEQEGLEYSTVEQVALEAWQWGTWLMGHNHTPEIL